MPLATPAAGSRPYLQIDIRTPRRTIRFEHDGPVDAQPIAVAMISAPHRAHFPSGPGRSMRSSGGKRSQSGWRIKGNDGTERELPDRSQ